jgi:processive 1,2-diacylglycerol beta-glucosyltransferase
VGVVTDFAVHAFWIHTNIELYAVATPEMRATLIARGVARDRIIVSGIPVRGEFSQPFADRDALRERLGLPLDRSTVLLMGGGLGIGPLEAMMHALDRVRTPLCALAIVGRSARSEQRVLEYAHRVGYPVRVVRFVHNVHEYMHASDVLITKPGGLTSAEALVARVPMVLFKPLPGQEERNTRYLVQRRAALRAKSTSDLTRTVESLLESPEKRDAMRAAMQQLGRPEAALEIAAAMRALAAGAQGEEIA